MHVQQATGQTGPQAQAQTQSQTDRASRGCRRTPRATPRSGAVRSVSAPPRRAAPSAVRKHEYFDAEAHRDEHLSRGANGKNAVRGDAASTEQ